MSGKSAYELESLFIEKLSEKYKLTERDIKRAFSQYDIDGNGLLDLKEITNAIQLYLNGVPRRDVERLVQHYDINGDGSLSFEEFFMFLTKRNAIPKTKDTSKSKCIQQPLVEPQISSGDHRRRKEVPSYPPAARQSDKHKKWNFQPDEAVAHPARIGVINAWEETAYESGKASGRRDTDSRSEMSSRFDPSDEHEIKLRAKRFIENIRALETKRSMSVRNQDKSYDKHTVALSEILDRISRSHVVEAMRPYVSTDEEARVSGVKLRDFCRLMRKYKYPGVDSERDEVLLYIFQAACLRANPQADNIQMALLDPALFSIMLFPPRASKSSSVLSYDKSTIKNISDGVFDVVADGPGIPPVARAAAEHDGANGDAGNLSGKRRSSLGRGPVINQNKSGLPLTLEPADLPTKFISRKTHNTLKAPYNFEPEVVKNSGHPPSGSLSIEYAFGLRTDYHSGNAIYGTQLKGTRSKMEGKEDPHVAVYCTAALGVVHRLDNNTQMYFNCHSDDICCIALSPDGGFVATGQIGKYPTCYIWSVADPTAGPIARIGSDKYFSRAVCSVCFSYDSQYLMAMSSDDHHTIGIFKISSGLLVCESVAGNGVPPQIRSSAWCSTLQSTAFISNAHATGKNDLFVTAGERLLKLWSFKRPVGLGGGAEEPASLLYSNAIMGRGSKGNSKFPVDHAPIYYCTAFIKQINLEDQNAGSLISKNDDLISGGSNGYVYLWRGQECVNVLKVSTSAVRAISVVGVYILVGCDGGVVKILQGNLVQVSSITVSHSSLFTQVAQNPIARPLSADARRRPVSTGRLGSRSGGVVSLSAAANNLKISNLPSSRTSSNQTAAGENGKFSARDLEFLGDASTWTRLDIIGLAYLGQEDDHTRALSPVRRDGGSYLEDEGRGTYLPPMFSGDLIVVASSGQTFKVYAQPLAAGSRVGTADGKKRSAVGSRESSASLSPELLFYFHVGPVWAVASKGDIIATGGDDKWICLWSIESHKLIGRFESSGAIRCINFDHTGTALTIGLTSGVVSVFSLDFPLASRLATSASHSNFPRLLYHLSSRKDASEEISDSKFNPTGTMIAAGSHDNYLYLYDCGFIPASGVPTECSLKLLKRLKGHSSYITHLDWSSDGRLIQSNCGAYEILYWDAMSGRQFVFRSGENPSNTKWKTETCVLGFSVMGIWPMYSDGTDINAVDVSKDHKLVVTGGDNGMVTLFNYPCVVKNPPSLEYSGHSSHVLCCRFAKNDTRIVSVGGNDECVICWKVRRSGGVSNK